MKSPFRAACFDLDGTLIDTEPLHLHAERETLRALGVSELAEDHPRTFGMGIPPGMAVLNEHYGLGGVGRVLETYIPLWDETVQERMESMPGALKLLDSLLDRGVALALVTSGNRAYAGIAIEKLRLGSHFSAVVTSDDVPELKPSPGPYMTAAEHLGVNASECVGFEDSGSGIAALKAAGMYSVAVHSDVVNRRELLEADATITSFSEVEDGKLSQWFGRSDRD